MYALLLAAAVFVAVPPPASRATGGASAAARLHGKVTDFHGNPLAGVRVTVVEFSRLVQTRSGGQLRANRPAERHL